MQLGISSVWLLGAPSLSSSSVPRCCVPGEDKKELLQTPKDELRKSILQSFVEKRPFRNAVKRNLPPPGGGAWGAQDNSVLRNRQKASSNFH